MQRIYLDYAASAPLYPEAKQAIQEFIDSPLVGNPSSLHAEGRASQALLDKAHTTVGAVFGVHPTEVIFTSGATESNFLAIHGVLAAWRKQKPGVRPKIIMSALEHPSCRQIIHGEEADIILVPVSHDGVVNPADIARSLDNETALVICMYANNEIGTIQPIAEIGKLVQAKRAELGSQFPVFHVDAVQAWPYLNTHSGHTHADTLTISGHKYGALGGSGALIVKKTTPVQSIIKGGGQEWGYRAGTENILGALALASVVEWSDTNREELIQHTQSLQHHLETSLAQALPQVKLLATKAERVPHITYLWLPHVIDEHMVHKLDLAGVAVSSGSACSSGATLPSSTLLALGYSEQEAFGGIRVSYGRFTTRAEIDNFIAIFQSILAA